MPSRRSTATPSRSLVRRLTVIGRRDGGGSSSIRVDDTGPGVPERARAHLFQAFQGGARPGGTGLGLAIAAELVRAHGGTIMLVDKAGPGATLRDRHPRPPRPQWPERPRLNRRIARSTALAIRAAGAIAVH